MCKKNVHTLFDIAECMVWIRLEKVYLSYSIGKLQNYNRNVFYSSNNECVYCVCRGVVITKMFFPCCNIASRSAQFSVNSGEVPESERLRYDRFGASVCIVLFFAILFVFAVFET